VWNHTGIPAQGSIFRNNENELHYVNNHFDNNSQNDNLPNTVRTLPNMVSFSLPMNRSTRLSYQDSNQNYNLDNDFWISFEQYLKNNYRISSIKPRFLYAKQYHQVLLEGNAQSLILLPNDKRLQVMKALSVLSKFMGCYDIWKEIKERYQLKWSDGNNSLHVFQTIVNNETNYDSMLKWVKDTCLQIPKSYANILIYCTLTGLRADEACQ